MSTIASVNAKHGAITAVSRVARTTQFAITAARIYLANNTTTDEHAITSVFNNTDKLVANRSIETRIPARDLEIRIADARQQHAHRCLISLTRLTYIFNCETFFIDAEGEHLFCVWFFVLCALTKYKAPSTKHPLKGLTSRVGVLGCEFDHLLRSGDG